MLENKQINKLSVSELNNLLHAGDKLLLLDPLPKPQYQRQHLPGAKNACVYEVSFLKQVAGITADKDTKIIVYGCHENTHDARTAVDKLGRAGYQQVAILEGGLAAWQDAGHMLEGEVTTEPEISAATSHLANGRYQIDTEKSVIEWSGRNPNSTHSGTLKLSTAEVTVENGKVTGNFIIDMNSIDNVNLAGNELKPVLDDHLKSDDFFFVKMFPAAKFKLNAIPTVATQPSSAPNYDVIGELSLCGISAEQRFPATIMTSEEGKLVAEAHFDIDRTRWGVIYGSTRFFEHLGMHLVFDQISLQLRILTQ